MRIPALITLLSLGCGEVWEPMKPSQVCDEVGYAIAHRAHACLGDEEVASARFHAFQGRYECRVEDYTVPIEDLYACPVAILAASCDEVESWGDDLSRYTASSDVCPLVVRDKEAPPSPSPDGGALLMSDAGLGEDL